MPSSLVIRTRCGLMVSLFLFVRHYAHPRYQFGDGVGTAAAQPVSSDVDRPRCSAGANGIGQVAALGQHGSYTRGQRVPRTHGVGRLKLGRDHLVELAVEQGDQWVGRTRNDDRCGALVVQRLDGLYERMLALVLRPTILDELVVSHLEQVQTAF